MLWTPGMRAFPRMGHVRLGELPRTRKWQQVVALLENGAGAAQVATATIAAAEQGLAAASNDIGLVETIWLLTQLPLAAKSDDYVAALRDAGLDVPANPTLQDVVSAFADAVDSRIVARGGRTDLGEMAEMAAVETINKLVGARSENLFGDTSGNVRDALAGLGTKAQFAGFARDFFARLTERSLAYYLSRAYAPMVGEGHRFSTLRQVGEFEGALRTHCREASKIVETFAGGWFTKTNWVKKGISKQDASGFAHIAMQKLVAELKVGARRDGK